MNQTQSILLDMLKKDVKQYVMKRDGVEYNASNGNEDTDLTGHNITISEIESQPSFKLMNDNEKQIVYSITEGMKQEKSISANTQSMEKPKQLVKSIMPYSNTSNEGELNLIQFQEPEKSFEFRDAA